MTDGVGAVLVVDDERLSRTLLSANLGRAGYVVDAAESGEQAIAMLDAKAYDLVLLDLIMPGVDGYDVLRHMKSRPALRDTPVIVISGVEEVESVVRCIELGAMDYLPKPFNPILLHARLKAFAESKRLRDIEGIQDGEGQARSRDAARQDVASQDTERRPGPEADSARLQRALKQAILILSAAVEDWGSRATERQQETDRPVRSQGNGAGREESPAYRVLLDDVTPSELDQLARVFASRMVATPLAGEDSNG